MQPIFIEAKSWHRSASLQNLVRNEIQIYIYICGVRAPLYFMVSLSSPGPAEGGKFCPWTKNARRTSQKIPKNHDKTPSFLGVMAPNLFFFVCLFAGAREYAFFWPTPSTSLVKNIDALNSHQKCILTVDNFFKQLSENILCPLNASKFLQKKCFG